MDSINDDQVYQLCMQTKTFSDFEKNQKVLKIWWVKNLLQRLATGDARRPGNIFCLLFLTERGKVPISAIFTMSLFFFAETFRSFFAETFRSFVSQLY